MIEKDFWLSFGEAITEIAKNGELDTIEITDENGNKISLNKFLDQIRRIRSSLMNRRVNGSVKLNGDSLG